MSFSVQDDTARCADNMMDDDAADMYLMSKGRLIDTIMQLQADNAQMQADFRSFNRRLNETARYFQWCDDYEERLDDYADGMKILQPVHRDQDDLGNTPDHYKVTPCRVCAHCGGQCYIQCCSCSSRWQLDCPDCGKSF